MRSRFNLFAVAGCCGLLLAFALPVLGEDEPAPAPAPADGGAAPADGGAPAAPAAGNGENAAGGAEYLDIREELEGKRTPKHQENMARRERIHEAVKAARAQANSTLNDERARMKRENEKRDGENLGDPVTVDGQTIQTKRPKSMEEAIGKDKVIDVYEIHPQDFDVIEHDRWSLNETDFQFDRPQYLALQTSHVSNRRWFLFPFQVTNSTTKPRRITPTFVAVTNNGVFMPEVCSFLPQASAAASTFHPTAHSTDPGDLRMLAELVLPMEAPSDMQTQQFKDGKFELPAQLAPTFEAGQTRVGVAAWPDFNDEWTELKIVVHGLTNAHHYGLDLQKNKDNTWLDVTEAGEKQRRVLVLSFTRNDDEFNVDRSNLKYLGKTWEYLWMWDQDLKVPIPADPNDPQLKDKVIDTPAGGKRTMVTFPYTLHNSTNTDQTIEVAEIRLALRGKKNGTKWSGFEVDVGGQKVALDEVHLIDDGRSDIYKAQFLREMGFAQPPADTNRFAPDAAKAKQPGGMVYKLTPDQTLQFRPAVFDGTSVDWARVRMEVETALTLAADRKQLGEAKWKELTEANKDLDAKAALGDLVYDPRRLLTDDTVTLKDGRKLVGEVTFQSEKRVDLKLPSQAVLELDMGGVEKVELGEMAAVRKQILDAVPAAIQALKDDKRVFAYFTCLSGLSSGSYRVSRSYRQPGVIDENWLKVWESELEPKAAP